MSHVPVTAALKQAYAIQDIVRAVLSQRQQGIKPDDDAVTQLVYERRELAAVDITAPIDGLVLAHQLLQGITAIHRCSDDPEVIDCLSFELATAATNLIRYFEECSGVTREALGLHDDYCGPTRN